MDRRGLGLTIGAFTLAAACGVPPQAEPTEQTIDTNPTARAGAESAVFGASCDYGVVVEPSLTLTLGFLKIKRNVVTGEITSTIGGSPLNFGFASIGFEAAVSNAAPSCYTLELRDSVRQVRYLIPIDSTEEVFVEASGSFQQLLRQERVLVEISELCELRVFSASQPVPPVDPDCGSASSSFWTVQLGSFKSADQAAQHVADLKNEHGIVGTSINDSNAWASICPGYFVVWSQPFARKTEADAFHNSAPVRAEDKRVKFASSDVALRDPNCR